MKNYVTIFTGVLLLFFMLSTYTSAESKMRWPDSVNQLVVNAKKSIKTIDINQFKAALDTQDFDMIIDVREPGAYATSHVPEAINIPRGVIEFKIWPYIGFPQKTQTNKKIILYCASGSRCSLAAKSLQDLGLTNVSAVDMKFKDWIKAGYPNEGDE
jgi:rhodanese-related sulfurtransferase